MLSWRVKTLKYDVVLQIPLNYVLLHTSEHKREQKQTNKSWQFQCFSKFTISESTIFHIPCNKNVKLWERIFVTRVSLKDSSQTWKLQWFGRNRQRYHVVKWPLRVFSLIQIPRYFQGCDSIIHVHHSSSHVWYPSIRMYYFYEWCSNLFILSKIISIVVKCSIVILNLYYYSPRFRWFWRSARVVPWWKFPLDPGSSRPSHVQHVTEVRHEDAHEQVGRSTPTSWEWAQSSDRQEQPHPRLGQSCRNLFHGIRFPYGWTGSLSKHWYRLQWNSGKFRPDVDRRS